ncbi:MAG: hypothetical protein ACYCOO_09760, partial [Chitinophagaceae bacterium]
PLLQDYSDMLGWKEMVRKVGMEYNSLDRLSRKKTIILCDNYGEAGAVEFYGGKYGLPDPLGFEASFILWLPDSQKIDNLILVSDNPEDKNNPLLLNHFSQISDIDSVTDPLSRERGTLIILCRHADSIFNKKFKGLLIKKRKEI